jgi:lysine 6-dehydrogenase
MSYTYAILGAGRQGTAAAYDMARWGEAHRVFFADCDLRLAEAAAERVNALLGREVAGAVELDVRNNETVERLLRDVDSCLSAVPYFLNLDITRAAVRAGCHLCDLGGHTGIAREQHTLDSQARDAGLSVIPNCGQVPGMGTTMMVYAMELLDEAVDVYMWDGGIPQTPRSPFRYLLTFNIAGLTNEYAEPGVFLRDWKIVEVEPMTEVESVEFREPFGTLEAFVTGGGTDTMPWTYEGRIRTLQNKTLRYPGHFAQLRAFYDLGLWDRAPMKVGDAEVVPRDVFHSLFEPRVTFSEDKDAILVRIRAVGKKDGRDAEALVETIDYFDDATGFTAMERCTGWSAAIVAEMMARGETPRGAGGVEIMVPARRFVEALRHRGIDVDETVGPIG